MNKWILALTFALQALLPHIVLADDATTAPLNDGITATEKPAAEKSSSEKNMTEKNSSQEAMPNSVVKEIPTTEKEFVKAINNYSKEQIIAQLGEPVRAEDVKLKDSGKVVASIWYYHNINTAEDGTYFPTTELDFIEGKVVQVVYMNNDGTEGPDTGQTYEVPSGKPDL